jgi:molybdopterin-guanine dinucleotide biosynthesis protein A
VSVPAAILAGGLGRRLGGPKATVEIGGVPLLTRVRRAAAEICDEVVVVAKAGDPGLGTDLRRIDEDYPERCPLPGVVAALRTFPGSPVLVLACDHPFLEPDLLALLVRDAGGADVRLPEIGGRLQPLVAVYGPASLEPLERDLVCGRLALFRALECLRLDLVREPELRRVDPTLRSFVNVNDRAALAEAERRADEKN